MKADVSIIGAGIGGLALGYRLARSGKRVFVAEKKDRVGGVVTTVEQARFLLEKGPNSFSNGAAMMELIDDAGLGDRVLAQPIRDHDRFVWKNGRLRKVPMGLVELVQSDVLTLGEKVRAMRGVFGNYGRIDKDVELGAFFRERLGDAVVESLLKPFMAGVYASDADRISLEAALPKLFEASKQHGKLMNALKSMRGSKPRRAKKRTPRCLVSFPNGIRELPERLADRITELGGRIAIGEEIALSRGDDSLWRVDLAGGEIAESETVVITSTAPEAAELLGEYAPSVASFLGTIEYAALTIVHAGLREELLSETRPGFGFLTVDGGGVEMLGSIWSSSIFPGRAPAGHRLLTCFFGGEKQPEANEWSDGKLREVFERDLKTTMGFRGGRFSLFEVTRWENALPIFRVGHMERLRSVLGAMPPGIHLLANYLGSISMPDRVDRAIQLLDRIDRQEDHG